MATYTDKPEQLGYDVIAIVTVAAKVIDYVAQGINFIDRMQTERRAKQLILQGMRQINETEAATRRIEDEITLINKQIDDKIKFMDDIVAKEIKSYADTARAASVAAVAGILLSFTGGK